MLRFSIHHAFAIFLANALFLGAPAFAQEDDEDTPRITATRADLPEIREELQSDNDDVVRGAIDKLIVIAHPDIVDPLVALLRSGPSDLVTDRALDALRRLGHASAIEVLTEFTNHRREGARRRAFQALAAIENPRVLPILAEGLEDSSRSIRGAVALAIGEIGSAEQLDLLFQAFERNVVEAAIAIGKIGDDAAVERFDGYLGNEPLGVMLSGYQEFLQRRDVSLEVKTRIVEQLGEISGTMVRRLLLEYQRALPARVPRRNTAMREHKELVARTIRRIPTEDGASQ